MIRPEFEREPDKYKRKKELFYVMTHSMYDGFITELRVDINDVNNKKMTVLANAKSNAL